jgi:hypothetical protein
MHGVERIEFVIDGWDQDGVELQNAGFQENYSLSMDRQSAGFAGRCK